MRWTRPRSEHRTYRLFDVLTDIWFPFHIRRDHTLSARHSDHR